MTDQEMRVAIAEFCEWTKREPYPSVIIWEGPMGEQNKDGEPPDYINNLNAMHEAEGLLFQRNDWAASRYEDQLQKLTTSWAWYATARQRAEAFLRTVGKWKEDA